jgi:hypothetical protein
MRRMKTIVREEVLSVLVAAGLALCASGALAQSAPQQIAPRGSRPAIATDGASRLHVVFEGYAHDSKVPDIYYTVSTDRGLHWSYSKNLSKSDGDSHQPDIAVEKSGAVDVVWTDNSSETNSPDIFFSRTTDDGRTWSNPIDVSSSPGLSGEPAITIGANDSIHVLWADTTQGEKNKDIFYVSSPDGGKMWNAPIDISNTPGASSDPAIAASQDGTVHAAWTDTTPGEKHPDIFYAQHKNDSWTTPYKVSDSIRVSSHPTIACSETNIFVAWSDNSRSEKSPDIWLTIGDPSGKFAHVLRVSDKPGVSTEPSIAAYGKDLAVVWSDTGTGAKTPSIYATGSTNNGKGFSSWINVSKTQGMASHPDVTIAGGKIYAVWEEVIPANGVSTVKIGSVSFNGLATSPTNIVDPKLQGVSGKGH